MLSRLGLIGYWICLTLWLGTLMLAGGAAAFVFATVIDMDLVVTEFASYDTTQHGRLVGGMIMDPVFFVTDVVQVVLAVVVIVLLVVQVIRRHGGPIANGIRGLALLGVAALLAYRILMVAPGMNADLRAYWEAARAGDAETATVHRLAFDAMHPTAARLYDASFALLFIAIGASAVATTRWRHPEPTPALEEPRLARSAS